MIFGYSLTFMDWFTLVVGLAFVGALLKEMANDKDDGRP